MTMFLTEAPAPTAEQIAQIEALTAEGKRALEMKEESFQRCDTDGFLSQWASGITADLNREKANLLKTGGYSQFPVLCDAEGKVLASKIYRFADKFRPDQWNAPMVRKWKLSDEDAAKYGRKWIPVAGYSGKSRIQKQMGLHEESRWFPAIAKITTGGRKSTGLSGCANAFVAVFKVGEENDYD
jgi:hypothetical protein